MISGYGDGIKLTWAEDCICRGNTIRLSQNQMYSNTGIRVAKGSNIRILYNDMSGGNDYGIYINGTEAAKKICLVIEIPYPDFQKMESVRCDLQQEAGLRETG